jgi:hypothetical protein
MASMIKTSKYLVLIAGLMGLAAIFSPFIVSTTDDGQLIEDSAWSLLTDTVEQVKSAEVETDPTLNALHQATALPGLLWLPVLVPVFLAALLLALLGTWGVMRGRFERLFGLLSLVLGLFVLGFAVILAGSMSNDELTSTGLGGKLLLGTGIAACVGGLLSLIKPDRRPRTAEPAA